MCELNVLDTPKSTLNIDYYVKRDVSFIYAHAHIHVLSSVIN